MSERVARGGLAIAGTIAIAGLAWHHMALEGDSFWMIASGRWLLEHRALPHADPFSFASMGERWTMPSTLACALFATVADRLGLRALLALGALVEALAVTTLWLGAARRPLARVALLPLALFFIQVDADDVSVRGQLFGDLGFVLLLAAFARLREGRAVHPALVALGAALWTNLHPSFSMLLVLPPVFALALRTEPAPQRPPLRPIATFVGWALLGACLNPYGPRYLAFAARLALDPSVAAFDLFRSPDFTRAAWLVAPALAALVVFARPRLEGSRFVRSEQAMLLVLLVAACLARRYATQLVALEIAVLGPVLDRIERARVADRVALSTAGIAAVLALLLGATWLRGPGDPLRDVPADAAIVARDAARALAASGARDHRVIDPLHWGGYLAYVWRGDPRYFIDGRDQVDLFGNGAFDDHAALWTGDARYGERLDVYEAGVVLWERGAWLDRALRADPRWRLVHEDRIAVVHVRANPR